MAEKKKKTKTAAQKKEDKRMMDELIEALKVEHGVMQWAFNRTGITYKVHSRLVREYPAYAEEVKEIREETKEWVFGKLMTLIEQGHPASTIFACKTMLHMKDANINKTTLEIKGANDLVDVDKALKDISNIVKDKEDKTDGGEQQD